MSKFDSAMASFAEALGTLETSVNRGIQRQTGANGLERELSALRQDRARLAQELDGVKSEAKALEGVTDEVSERLDTAIRDIRSVLEQ
jgi:predicted  nucleic acid-binding Zn-ribbon protein